MPAKCRKQYSGLKFVLSIGLHIISKVTDNDDDYNFDYAILLEIRVRLCYTRADMFDTKHSIEKHLSVNVNSCLISVTYRIAYGPTFDLKLINSYTSRLLLVSTMTCKLQKSSCWQLLSLNSQSGPRLTFHSLLYRPIGLQLGL